MLGQSFGKLDTAAGLEAIQRTLKSNTISAQLLQLAFLFISVLALPARLYVRKNFGERAFSLVAFVAALLLQLFVPLVLLVFAIMLIVEAKGFDQYGIVLTEAVIISPLPLFLYFQIKFGVAHFKGVLNSLNGGYKYSRYRGEPSENLWKVKEKPPKWGFVYDDDYVRRFVEPEQLKMAGGLIVLGSVLILAALKFWYRPFGFDMPISAYNIFMLTETASFLLTGLYLWASAYCLSFEEMGLYYKYRSVALDMLDSAVEMEHVHAIRDQMTSDQLYAPATEVTFSEVVPLKE